MEVHPFTAVLCYIWSAVSVLFYLFAYYVGGVAPRWSNDLMNIGYHAGSAILLIFSAFVLELGFLWTGLMFAESGQPELKKTLRGHRLMDSFLTLLEYVIKFVTGITIWQFDGPVHIDIWAVGGERPVFFVRFAQWSVAVPLLILISNRAFLAEYGFRITMMRSLPALIVTFWSVWLAWLMEVTTDYGLRWPCMFVSGVGLFLPLADQVQLCLQCRDVKLYKLKYAMLIYQIVSFIFYAAIFMFGRFGIIELSMEQIVYAYCDSTVKVLQGALLAMIRSCEDAEQIHRWYAEAVAYKKDFDTIVKLAHVPVVTFLQDGTILRLNEAASELFNSTDDKSLVGFKFTDMIRKDKKDLFDQSVQELCEKDKSAGSGLLELTCKSPYREDDRYLLVNLVTKKNRLMAVVSHELRSPLHGMIGLAANMMELVTNDGMKRQLGMVKSCGARLLDLVTNVMDLSESEQRKRAGSKERKPYEQKVNFLAITEEAVVMSRMAVDKANKPLIKAGVELKNCTRDIGKVPIVKGNPYKCTQMIYNLLTNACKFTVNGSVSVCAKHIKEQSILEISVVDTGCGISPEAQKRIFKPFEQEHSSSGDSRNFQGLGLGLAVVLEIVQMHNASIRVESEVGKGSSFIVSFACVNDEFCEDVDPVPTVTKRSQSEATPAAASGASGAPSTSSHGKTAETKSPASSSKPATRQAVKRKRPLILSVDDCEVNQEIIKSVLAAEYELVCCMDGPSGLDWLEKNRANNGLLPDVILLDIQMPGMTGYDVCKKIRQHYEESRTALPIMMLSANATKIAAVRSKENGSTDFIAKPFAKDFLKSKIQEVLKMKEVTSDFSEPDAMNRQSTEDLSMEVMGAKATVLEAEKNEMEARAVKAELRAAVAESKLVDMHQLQGPPVSLQEPGPITLGIDMAQDMTELEFLHNELVQREVTIARLESELGRSRASNQLISRRLQMQNRLNQMLHDTLLEGCDDSASCSLPADAMSSDSAAALCEHGPRALVLLPTRELAVQAMLHAHNWVWTWMLANQS
eukprot:s3117_g2.t2